MRRFGALLLLLLLLGLVACNAQVPREEPESAPKPIASSPSRTATPPALVSTRLPAQLAHLPKADIGIPARMPTGRETMPSLLDDPPGRAVMAYRPVERLDDPESWSGETIYLYGVDGAWRRLSMADLGLPQEWWPGADMYGVGDLSPDGRTWAAHAGPMVVLLDLRTSRWRLVRVADRTTSVRWAWWLPDGKSLQVHVFGTPQAPNRHHTFLVDVTGKVRRSPYQGPVGFEPDGTAVAFRHGRVGAHRLRWTRESEPPERESVPTPWGRWGQSFLAAHGEELFALPLHGPRLLYVVADRATRVPVAQLATADPWGYGRVHAWLDERTVLMSTRCGLLTWTPREQRLRRVAMVPTARAGEWEGWSASFAMDLLRPPR